MDEYSKTGPKSPKASRAQRARELHSQMSDLLSIKDEQTLVSTLTGKYDAGPGDPRFEAIMQIWRDVQRQLQRGR